MTQQENDELMYASEEDIAFYHKCVEGLPTLAGLNGTGKDADGVPLPYGCGPHSVRCIREIIEIVKPNRIMEIGLNMGYSSSLWLNLAPEAHVTSCDISYKEETLVAAKLLWSKNPERFLYFNRNVGLKTYHDKGYTEFDPPKYDLIFIDGSHLLEDVKKDIEWALELNIPHIAFDDYLPEFGDVQKAIECYSDKIEQVKVMGNIALYKNITV